jgi:hypothetical protein
MVPNPQAMRQIRMGRIHVHGPILSFLYLSCVLFSIWGRFYETVWIIYRQNLNEVNYKSVILCFVSFKGLD